ncbi:MAG TPA: SRPBCC family protein, partial [bacterium]|nr:SRPBCC family protein [bacterium]
RTLPHAPETVWEALTDPKALNKWFTTKAKQDLKVGGRYSNGDGDQGTFVTIKPPKKLTFTWENPEHSPGSLVVFDLWPKEGGKTLLRVTQSKLQDQAAVDAQKEGWSWALDSLKHYLETGKGIRHEEWQAARKP